MAKFFVGQRVRVVKVMQAENTHFLHREARIEAAHAYPFLTVYGLDISPLEPVALGPLQVVRGWLDEQLEPLVPEAQEPCESDFKLDLDRLLEREGVKEAAAAGLVTP